MRLVQLFLPLRDPEGARFERAAFDAVREQLAERFGGSTAFVRSPAAGLREDDGALERDDVVLFEVMVASFDRDWWRDYRNALARRFAQETILVRAWDVDQL